MRRSFNHNRLTLSLLTEILPITLIAFTALTLLVFVQQAGKYLNIVLSFYSSYQVAFHFLWSLIPGIVVITLPVSLLLGTVITCSRLSTDGEITALQSLGISKIKIAISFLFIGILGALLTTYLLAEVAPQALKTLKELRAKIILQEANKQISHGSFVTRFPDTLLYIRDVDSKTGDWLGVFILRQEGNQKTSRLLTAERGQLRIIKRDQLGFEVELHKVISIESKIEDGLQSVSAVAASATASIKFMEHYSGNPESGGSGPLSEMTLSQVAIRGKAAPSPKERLLANVEWHRRFAFPFACITLTLTAFIIALQGRRLTSKPRTTVGVLFLAMLFYLLLVAGQNLASSEAIPVWLGVWFSNLVFGAYIALSLINDKPMLRIPLLFEFSKQGQIYSGQASPAQTSSTGLALPALNPFNLINYLLISEVFKYYLIAVAALVMTSLVFTLFDLIPAIAKTGSPIGYVLSYLGYLSPQFIYQVSPFALLVGILTGCSVLARSNQLAIIAGAGQSRFRAVIPVVLTVAMVGFFLWLISDHLLPYTNREQDFRYNKIKGRLTEQTTIAFGKKWIYGKNNTIYSFQSVGSDNSLFHVSAYYLSPQSNLLEKSVHFGRATQVSSSSWVATDGWAESVKPDLTVARVSLSASPQPIIIEDGIGAFRRTVNESSKMDSKELRYYINQLKGVGTSTIAPELDLGRRMAMPFSCLTLAVLAIPFALTQRARKFSPLLSVALSVGIGLVFWLVMSLFEAAGQQESLPINVAVWGPQILFMAAGLYLNFRLRAHI